MAVTLADDPAVAEVKVARGDRNTPSPKPNHQRRMKLKDRAKAPVSVLKDARLMNKLRSIRILALYFHGNRAKGCWINNKSLRVI